MPLDAPARPLRMTAPELRLPPPFTLVRLRELGDAFAHARTIAAEAGAGTLVHVGRFDIAEFALVLEPEEPLATARRAFIAGMAAMADALAAYAQPETLIEIHWPGGLTVNLGLVGGGRLAWPGDAKEEDVPDWLVFGGMIRTASMLHEPGVTPNATALAEEGFGETSAADIVESFARNMMVHIDAWQEKGFGVVAKSYLERLSGEGLRLLADNGDLMLRRPRVKETERDALVPALARDPWSDPATLEGRARTAFRSGFLGVASLGWSTLVQIVEASEDDRVALVGALAQRLVSDYGAPDLVRANAAAEDEVAFAESLCDQPVDTLVAVHRSFEGGELREAFRTLKPRNGAKPARAFSVFDVEGEEETGDAVDLVGMAEQHKR